jgi:hypothetical protein
MMWGGFFDGIFAQAPCIPKKIREKPILNEMFIPRSTDIVQSSVTISYSDPNWIIVVPSLAQQFIIAVIGPTRKTALPQWVLW